MTVRDGYGVAGRCMIERSACLQRPTSGADALVGCSQAE